MEELFMFVIFIIFIIGSLWFGIMVFRKASERQKEYLERRQNYIESIIAKYGEPTKLIGDYTTEEKETVFVFEKSKIIIIIGTEYDFDSLLDFSINGSQSYKVATSTGSALGRGIVGGFLLGEIGALAGANTASKTVTPNESDYTICITTKDLINPMIEYRTKNSKRANELVSILKIILDRNKQ